MEDDSAVDEAAVFGGGEAEGRSDETVEVTQGASGHLVQACEGIGVHKVSMSRPDPDRRNH